MGDFRAKAEVDKQPGAEHVKAIGAGGRMRPEPGGERSPRSVFLSGPFSHPGICHVTLGGVGELQAVDSGNAAVPGSAQHSSPHWEGIHTSSLSRLTGWEAALHDGTSQEGFKQRNDRLVF